MTRCTVQRSRGRSTCGLASVCAVAMLALGAQPAGAAVCPSTPVPGVGCWHDASGRATTGSDVVPATTELLSVAVARITTGAAPTSISVVIAVGQTPGATGQPSTPAIYRLVGGSWYADHIQGSVGTLLRRVAIAGTTAYAIGATTAGSPPATTPLIVTLSGSGQLTQASPATWVAVPAPGGMTQPEGLALVATSPSEVDGFIGDRSSQVFSLSDAGSGTTFVQATPSPTTTPTGGVTGIAAFPASRGIQGFAVTGSTPPGSASSTTGFFALASPSPGTAATVAPSSTSTSGAPNPLTGLAALSASDAIAIDDAQRCGPDAASPAPPASSGYWLLTASGTGGASAWQRQLDAPASQGGSPTAPLLCDVTIFDDTASAQVTQAIAGADADAAGAVWRRQAGTAGWVADYDLSPASLNGVAVASRDNLWTVGAHGTVLHYYVEPPPSGGTGSGSGSSPGSGSGSSPGSDPGSAGSQPSSAAGATPSATTPAPIVVPVPPAGAAPTTTPPRRSAPVTHRRGTKHRAAPKGPVLHNLSVRRAANRLFVTFSLTAPARVDIAATRGLRVLARATTRRLSNGRQRVVLTFAGNQPPTKLKILVHPMK